CLLSKTSSTTLRIDNDVYFERGKKRGNGEKEKKGKRNKIMGWK
ncbi:hypothetical protein, partial [Staphylococcus aureus]